MLSPEYIQKLMRLDTDATVNDAFSLSERDVDIMAINKLRRYDFTYDKTTQAFNQIIIESIEKNLSDAEIFLLKTAEIKRRSLKFDVSFTRTLLSR